MLEVTFIHCYPYPCGMKTEFACLSGAREWNDGMHDGSGSIGYLRD